MTADTDRAARAAAGSVTGAAASTPGAATAPAVPASAPGPSGVPDLLYGETEQELRAAVRELLADRAGWQQVLAGADAAAGYDTGLWQALAAGIGCAGLLVPEDLGGAGASYREAAVVAEEAGRAVAPVPYLGSAVLATAALLSAAAADDAEAGLARELLAGVAGGATTAALAVPFALGPPAAAAVFPAAGPLPAAGEFAAGVRLGPPRGGDEAGTARLTGTVTGIADALPAGLLLVPADGVPAGLYAVAADDPGVTLAPVVSLDMTRPLADLTLDGAAARRVASGPAVAAAIGAALTAGAAMIASEQLGLAERCLELTVSYVQERRQFGRPVGSFQALKHRLADLWTAIAQARAAARYAAACLAAGDPDTPVAVALAKSACSQAALKAAEEAVQLHGGIGFTWEHPVHLYLKRAKADSIGLGTAAAHRAALAGLVGLPAPAARPAG